MKPKKCRQCKELYYPAKPMQSVCSPKCAYEYVTEKNRQKAKKENRKAKKELNQQSRGWWLDEAQREFNKYIRLRDRDEPCISSGKHHTGQYHAGHYRSVGAAPQLRFNEDNCHKQSSYENNHKSGNIGEYRINLIKKIGLERVEALENDNTIRKYTIEELKEIKEYYKQEVKRLEERDAKD